jgi:hypothetical protein
MKRPSNISQSTGRNFNNMKKKYLFLLIAAFGFLVHYSDAAPPDAKSSFAASENPDDRPIQPPLKEDS